MVERARPEPDKKPAVAASVAKEARPTRAAGLDPGAGAGVAAYSSQAGLVALQRTAGNQAAVALVSGRPPVLQRNPAGPVIQREPDPDAAIEALNIVNKNSTFKLKFEGKPSVPGGGLEIKKVTLEIDGTNEVSAPGLTSSKAGTAVKGGSQATAASDTKKAAAQATAARVHAAELQGRIPGLAQTRVRDMLKYKVSGEATPGKEAKAAAGVALDSEYVSGEVMFNFLKIDLAAKDPKDRFKPLTAQIKVGTGKLLEHSFPKALRFAGHDGDLKLRVKISGVIEVGPRWEMLEGKIVERFGKKALEAYRAGMIETIAREESTMLAEQLSEKIAKEATKDIADKEIREIAFAQAKQKAMETAAERGIDKTMVDVMAREATKVAAEKTDLTAARAAMRVAGETGAREAFEVIGKTVLKEAIKDTLRAISLRRLGASMLAALALGPVDVALIALDMLATSLIEIIRSQQIKEMGMTAQLVRDNYVKGYRDGLAGKVSGQGQPGGGSPEGAAFIAGATDGSSQFQQNLTVAMADRPELAAGLITKAEIEEQVKAVTATLDVPTDKILATATPKLEQMLIDAYVKANTGLLDKIFGRDPKESKSFKDFERVIKSNLQSSATRTTRATLSNGVTLTLTALDYTGENARRFRTEDGRYIVKQGGDTTKHSGWITDDGRPLEEIYTNQATGNQADQGSPGQLARMQGILDGLTAWVSVQARGGTIAGQGLRLSGPGADDEQFAQYVRTADAQAKTLGSFRSTAVMLVYLPTNGAQGGIMHLTAQGTNATVQDAGSTPQNVEKYARGLGIDTKDRDVGQAIGQHYWRMLFPTMLAGLPPPQLRG